MFLRRPEVPDGLKLAPELSRGLPLVGHTVEFVRDTIGMLERANHELGEIAAVRVAGRRMVALFGPEAHEAVFRAKDAVLDPREAYKIMTPVFGEGMVYDATPEKMAEQFKMLLPALKDRRMRTYGETILDEVERSVADWGDEGEVDVVDYCRVLTNFTSSRCLIGEEFRERMTDEFARIYHDLERGVTPLAYIDANLPIPSFKKRDQARVRLVKLIGEIIEERKRTGRTGEDFLQTLMEARYEDGAALTHDEITGMLLAAMFAGHHTSSVTTAWALIELCRHPAYMRRVVAELDEVYGADGQTDYASLRNIPVTEHAVKETLRLYPPLFLLIRVVQKDWVYKGHHLPKGTWVLVSPTVSQRDRAVFTHPYTFDPDRFAEPRSEGKKDWAFIAFGGGRHKCLGNAFALLQIKAILGTLPMSGVITTLFVLLCFIFLATTLDSSAYVLASVTSRKLSGYQEPQRKIRLIWAFLIAGVGVALIQLGGLKPVQTSTIVVALPMIPVLAILAIAAAFALGWSLGAAV